MAEKSPRKKALPEDAEEYVSMARERASPSGKVMERVKQSQALRLETATNELELATVEKALKAAKDGVTSAQGSSIVFQLFQGKSPREIKELLETLTPEAIQKLTVISQAADPVSALLKTTQQQPSNRDDLLIKYLFEERAKSTENLIQMIKLMKEMTPQPAPQPVSVPQQQPQQNQMLQTLEMVKTIGAMNEPIYKLMSSKDKEIMDMKLKEIESKMPADPIEQFKYIKEMAGELGLSGSAKSEIDLKLEEMRENREIDMKRLDWEQKKYELEADNDVRKWEQIGKILQGPIGQALRNVGDAGADRVRGRKGAPPPSTDVHTVQTQCPNCQSVIWVDGDSETAICGHCGAQLQRQSAPAPVAPTPTPPTRVSAQPAPPAPVPENETEDEEEEEEKDGHNETEEEQQPPAK